MAKLEITLANEESDKFVVAALLESYPKKGSQYWEDQPDDYVQLTGALDVVLEYFGYQK